MRYTRSMTNPPPFFPMPWHELRFALIANAGALTQTHLDAFATSMTVITGEKFIAIGYARPSREEDTEYRSQGMGDFYTRDAFEGYARGKSNDSYLNFEFLVLRPNATLQVSHFLHSLLLMCASSIMPPTTFHWVLSTKPTIADSLHFIPGASMDKAVEVTLHNIVMNYLSTNVDHTTARRLLTHIYIYQAEYIMAGNVEAGHVPDLTTPAGIVDLLYLQSFVVLSPAFDTPSYAALVDGLLPIGTERLEELQCAWNTVGRLLAFIEDNYVYSANASDEEDSESDSEGESFQNFTQVSMVRHDCLLNTLLISFQECILHLALAMTCYTANWDRENSEQHPNFTGVNIREQLGRSMQAFLQAAPRLPREIHADFMSNETVAVLVRGCDDCDDYDMLLPWGSHDLPFTLSAARPPVF